ncbi:MAG: cysteine synthase A [Bacillota bacterium]
MNAEKNFDHRSKIAENIIDLIGNTPHYKTEKFGQEFGSDIYIKLEMFNPGKSVKDRIAWNMIRRAEESGELSPGGVIVEPTSGNTGIGLAMIGAARGYRVILTMPDTMSVERRKLLKAYGAELILTPGDSGMNGAIETARKLVHGNEGYFMPDQFTNPANPEAHRLTTAREILNDFSQTLDYIVLGVGTGGTLTGVGQVMQEESPDTKIIAVEPEGSPVLSGGEAGSHKIQGIGAGFIPEIMETELIDQIIKVSNDEAYNTARELASKEGLLVGISSGAAAAATRKLAETLENRPPSEKNGQPKILTLAPDSGERYLSTELFKN